MLKGCLRPRPEPGLLPLQLLGQLPAWQLPWDHLGELHAPSAEHDHDALAQ